MIQLSERRFLVSEVAQILKCHEETVRNMIRQRRLKAVKFGKRYQVAESELERLLNE